MTYENIQVETRGAVALITLNRPKAFNALSDDMMDELSLSLIHILCRSGGDTSNSRLLYGSD